MTPNPEQELAIAAMLKHARTTGDCPFYVLRGPAGTGKTFTIQKMREEFKGRAMFCAPTNKAVRVIREVLNKDGAREECRTIFSALGLQMAPNGEVKELRASEDDVDLSDYRLIVIDEAGMLGKGTEERRGIFSYILEASKLHPRLRWILMGDPFQLPPVGERESPVWTQGWPESELVKVMRTDNQILTLSQHLREMVLKPFGSLRLRDDNDGEEGVWCLSGGRLDQAAINQADSFLSGASKAIAWRNVEVDRMNRLIRTQLFADSLVYPWQQGDRITLLGPAKDLEGEIIGTTDEEGAVEKCEIADHPLHELKCYRIVMRSDMNSTLTLWTLHPDAKNKFELRKARLAAEARASSSQWGKFWDFADSFHPVRHAYAQTAHRAQGSTYTRAFVSWRDILLNNDRGEAMRCLYVGATRPKKELYLG